MAYVNIHLVINSLYARIAALRDTGRHFAVATVVRTHGSTPQVAGATLVLGEGEDVRAAVGTLGGGCVEADAVDAALEVIQTGEPSLRAYELTEDLAWNTGLVFDPTGAQQAAYRKIHLFDVVVDGDGPDARVLVSDQPVPVSQPAE